MSHHRITPPNQGVVYTIGTHKYGWRCSVCGHEESPYHYYQDDAWDQLGSHLKRH